MKPREDYTEWTIERLDFLDKNFKSMTNAELAAELGINTCIVKNKIHELGLKGKTHNRTTKFYKGMTSWNKGMKGFPSNGRMAETQFKKGREPHNSKFDGATRYMKDKRTGFTYIEIRVAKAKWQGLHRFTWQKHYGEIPPRHIITFRDGYTMNCKPENLECITIAENLRRNRN